jgi:RNA-directed DNA polymerase
MLSDSPHLYASVGRQPSYLYPYRVIPEERLRIARRNASRVQFGCYPLLTLGDLAFRTSVDYVYLRQIVGRRIDPYTDIPMTSSRKTRAIAAPEERLMRVQGWINRHILSKVPVPRESYAYVRGRSIVDCATRHCGCKWMIKTDIHDYFHSIVETRVFQTFVDLGYNRLLSFELARISTRGSVAALHLKSGHYSAITDYTGAIPGWLPQGAPTSGALANISTAGLDKDIASWAADRSLVYTRYSDDIALSSGDFFNRAQAVQYIGELSRIIQFHGFEPHQKKTRIVSPGARRVVVGLLVDRSKPALRPEYKAKISQHIRGVGKFGLLQHADHFRFKSVFGFMRHIEGHLAFAEGVEPAWAN